MSHQSQTRSIFKQLEPISVAILCLSILTLPIQRFNMPLNTAIPDYFNILALFIMWLFIIKNNLSLRLPFIISMWIIWLASLLSAFYSPNHLESLQVIAQELYLYLWFVTLSITFVSLHPKSRRQIFKFWIFAAIINGSIILLQFASPDFLQQTTSFVGKYDFYGSPRPLGLYKNPNIAANFQLLAFVPLFLLVKIPNRVRFCLSAFLILTIIATGSLGISLSLLCGAAGSFILLQTAERNNLQKGKFFFQILFFLVLGFIGFQIINQQFPELAARLDFLYYSRFGGSAANRLTLWEQGQEVIANELSILGLGPGAFKDTILGEKALHNDAFSFLVERGLLGALGLLLLALQLFQRIIKSWKPSQNSLSNVYAIPVLLAALIAIAVTSQTHEVFHFRSVWLVTAVIESVTYPFTLKNSYRSQPHKTLDNLEDLNYQQA